MAARTATARCAFSISSVSRAIPKCPRTLPRAWQQRFRAPQARAFSQATHSQEKKYSRDHEWVEMAADGKTCTLGISAYAAKALGDVVYVELPEISLEVSAGDAIGAVESVKSASDIYAPVGGTVTESNSVVEEKPGELNRDPEGEGWIAKIEVSEEAQDLMTQEEYRKFTEDVSEE